MMKRSAANVCRRSGGLRLIDSWKELENGSRIVLLFSGGFDSTYVGYKLLTAGYDVYPVIFEYPNRPKMERKRSNEIALRIFKNDIKRIDLDINDHRLQEKYWTSPRREGWIPFRNILFFSYAAHHAYFLNARYIASGVRVWDTTALNDATPSYFEKLGKLLLISGDEERDFVCEIFLPLINSDQEIQEEIANDKRLIDLLRSTWSCWRSNEKPCGVCAPCKSRLEYTVKAFGESI